MQVRRSAHNLPWHTDASQHFPGGCRKRLVAPDACPGVAERRLERLPGRPAGVEARLYKLLLYDEGGHFKASDNPVASHLQSCCQRLAYEECTRCVWKLSRHCPSPTWLTCALRATHPSRSPLLPPACSPTGTPKRRRACGDHWSSCCPRATRCVRAVRAAAQFCLLMLRRLVWSQHGEAP